MMRIEVRPVMWRSVVIVLALFVAVFGATRRQSRLTIAIHQGVEGVALRRVAESFSRQRNVVVEVKELSYDDLFDEELRTVTGNEGTSKFGVIMLDDPWLPALLEAVPGKKSLVGKKALWADDENGQRCKDDLDDFFASTLKVGLGSVEGEAVTCASTLYALPFVGNTQLFAIPKDLEQLPTTWADVKRAVGDGQRGAGYVMRAGPGNSIVTDFMPILWGTDSKSFQSSDSLRVESSEAVSFVGALGRIPGAMRAVVATDDFDLAIYLAKGQASMGIVWSAWAMAVAKLPAATTVRELVLTQVPGGKHAVGAWLLAIPSNAADRDKTVGADFIRFATKKEQLKYAALIGNPPPRRSVLNFIEKSAQKAEKSDQNAATKFATAFQGSFLRAQRLALETAMPRPRTRHWRDIEKALGSCLSALYENAIDDQEAVDRSNQAIAAILNKERPRDDCWVDSVKALRLPSAGAR